MNGITLATERLCVLFHMCVLFHITSLDKSCPRTFTSVTREYNLVLAKGQWCSSAENVAIKYVVKQQQPTQASDNRVSSSHTVSSMGEFNLLHIYCHHHVV